MKKLFYTMATAFLACAPTLSAQENLLGNPGFEEWTDGQPASWEAPFGTKETEIIQEGTSALRLTAVDDYYEQSGFNILRQDVASPTLQAGDVYEVTIWYYGVSNTSVMNTISFQSYWNDDPTEKPYHQSVELKMGEWQQATFEVPVANELHPVFHFELWINIGQTVVVDNFSMKLKSRDTEPYLLADPTRFPTVRTTVGTPVEIGKAIVKYGNLGYELGEDNGTLFLSGSDRDQFGMEVASRGEGELELTLTYNPTEPTTTSYGQHHVSVYLDGGGKASPQSISLSGQASLPGLHPEIIVDRTEVTFPETQAGTSCRDTIYISGQEMKEEIKAVVSGDSVFYISTSFIMPDADRVALGIEYRPVSAGTQTGTITLSSWDAETRTITLSGTATGDITHPDKQGDEYPLDDSHPVALLHETFDNAVHNEPLLLDGWKNIAEQNYRAWWGYDFSRATPPTDDGGTAKATLFNSLNPAQEPYEMWLYTPALDFKNAASKVFTFRVSASLISDEARTDSIELYYVEMDDNEPHGLFRQPVGGVYMPSTADDNDEWFSYHLDLGAEGNAVADTFFMAFRVSGTGGGASAASYYIDDVSFGRTDLPKIHLEQTQIAFEAQPGATATTSAMTVTTENLTEPITLTVGGTHKSRFKVVPETLPAEGGSFQVEFSSDEAGLYAAYVKLASRDAADVYLDMLVNNQHSTSINQVPAIAQVWCTQGRIHVTTPQAAQADVYALTGHRLASYPLGAGTSALPCTLQQGVYLLQLTNADGTTICRKVAVKK